MDHGQTEGNDVLRICASCEKATGGKRFEGLCVPRRRAALKWLHRNGADGECAPGPRLSERRGS